MTSKYLQNFGKLSLCLLGITIFLLATFTIVEKYYGSDFVLSNLYGSLPFALIWAITVTSGSIYIFYRKLWKRLPAFMLHLSMIVILLGAGTTFLFAKHGNITINKESTTNVFVSDNNTRETLPLSLKLITFDVEYYPGSSAPLNYHAIVKSGNQTYNLSMNKIASIDGYNFCLKDYDPQKQTLSLSVSHDYGCTIAYIGFFLFFISSILILIGKKGEFSTIRKRLMQAGIVSALLIAGGNSASAQIINSYDAETFSKILVEQNGRIMPVESMAWSLMTKIHGSSSFEGMSATQTLVDIYLNSDEWGECKFIKIKDSFVKEILGISGNYASYNDFLTDENVYKLKKYLESALSENKHKAVASADEKFQVMRSVIDGDVFKIFPAASADKSIVWYSPTDRLPAEVSDEQYIFIRNAFNVLTEYLITQRHADFQLAIAKIAKYQEKTAEEEIPSRAQRKCEHWLNAFRSIPLFAIALTIGILGWIFTIVAIVKSRPANRYVSKSLFILIAIITAALTVEFALKWFVGNHIPLGSGPETMTFTALAIGAIFLFTKKRLGIDPAYALIMMGLTLLVARIGNSDPQVTQLMPVLNSSLLSVHVALVMMSYALFALIFINSLTSLCVRNETTIQERFSLTGKFMLYPALLLLGAGIFVGSIWANISWGRYWGWDPKETWALITMLIYSLPFHTSIIPAFNKPRIFNAFLTIAFLAVIITYFGVNYFLGGMHSYS